jgi:hypothetical protein
MTTPGVPPTPDRQLSFSADIKPLFRASDRAAMAAAFDLWSPEDVRAHGTAIIGRLRNGSMPCDGPWPAAQVDLLERWVADGTLE